MLSNDGGNQSVLEDSLTADSLNPSDCQRKTDLVQSPDLCFVKKKFTKVKIRTSE